MVHGSVGAGTTSSVVAETPTTARKDRAGRKVVSEELTLIENLRARPAELEHSLSTAMSAIGVRIVERPEIARALEAANLLKDGYVVTTNEQAVEIADLVAQVIDGERTLAEEVRTALRIPNQMEVALKGAVTQTKDRLAHARQTGNAARVAWQATLRRQAIELEAKARQEAQEAARRAAEQAAEIGEDAPPVAETAPIEVPRTVSGGAGKMGTQTRIEPGEVVDWSACPKEWLALVPGIARTSFLAACMEKKVQKPEPGESVVWKGVRFEARESAVNRR